MLKVQDLFVAYGGIEALKGISLEVPEGKIVTLIGANGAGKSTLLRTIVGLVKPKSGTISYNEQNITGLNSQKIVKTGITLVPEGRRVFPNLTVLENLQIGAYMRNDKEEIAKDIKWVYELFPRLEERSWQMVPITLSTKFGALREKRGEIPRPAHRRKGENSVSMVYAVANQKGGVGKSTTVVNLGAYLGSRGKRVLCVDIDPQGNTTTGLGIKKKLLHASSYEVLVGKCSIQEAIVRTAFENVSLLPAKNTLAGAELELSNMDNRMNRLKMQLLTCKLDYDYIFIDCPPALGLLTVNGLVAADQLIIPMLAEFYALEGLSQLTNTIKVVRSNYNPNLDIGGILFVMFDQRLNVSRQVEEEVKKYFPGKVFQTKIPRNVRLSEAPSHGKPVMYYDRLSRGAEAYMLLGLELLGEKPPEKKRRMLAFGRKRERDDL